MAWLALAGAIALEVIATISLKQADGFTRLWPSVVVVVGYVGCFTLLGYALKTFDVGLVYAIWSAIGTAAITIAGIMLFGETITLPRVCGVGLIVLGVVVLNLSGGEAHAAGAKAEKMSLSVDPEPVFAGPISLERAEPVKGPKKPPPGGPEFGEAPMLTPRTGLIPRQARPRHDMRTDPDSELKPVFPDLRRPGT